MREAQRGVREGDAGGGGDGSGSGVQRLQPSNLSARRQGLQSWGKGGGIVALARVESAGVTCEGGTRPRHVPTRRPFVQSAAGSIQSPTHVAAVNVGEQREPPCRGAAEQEAKTYTRGGRLGDRVQMRSRSLDGKLPHKLSEICDNLLHFYSCCLFFPPHFLSHNSIFFNGIRSALILMPVFLGGSKNQIRMEC